MTFEEYVAAIQVLAERDSEVSPGTPYCDVEAWRKAYDDGDTPEQAWQAECDAALDLLG